MINKNKREGKMKKIYLYGGVIALAVFVVALFSISSVNALEDLGNGTYILEQSEFAALTDQQIANYMVSQLTIQEIKVHEDKIEIIYSLVHIEPTHDANNTFRVFNHPYQTFVTLEDIIYCTDLTTVNNCVGYLVTNSEPFEYQISENETKTFTPTYVKAVNAGINQYNRAIEFRDSISNKVTMEDFVNAI